MLLLVMDIYPHPDLSDPCIYICLFSDRNFDESLKQRDPHWGIRDLEQVVAVAKGNGLELIETREMPANNLIVLFRKQP